MRSEIDKTVVGAGPGRPEWRAEISKILQETYREVAENYIEFEVGVPASEKLATIVRAMVIAEGAGSAVGNPPIKSKPGQEVWNSDLSGRKISQAQIEFTLPDGFNQSGNHFIENAIKLMGKHFEDVLENAKTNQPEHIFYNNVCVAKR